MNSIEECNKEKLVTIWEAGTYIVSGTLTGQLAIEISGSDSTQSVNFSFKRSNYKLFSCSWTYIL